MVNAESGGAQLLKRNKSNTDATAPGFVTSLFYQRLPPKMLEIERISENSQIVSKNSLLNISDKKRQFSLTKSSNDMDRSSAKFDVLIIGGGPAGMAAALWCADLGLSAIILEKKPEFGGQLLRTYAPITNYPGRRTADGREMRDNFAGGLAEIDVVTRMSANVIGLDTNELGIDLDDGSNILGNSIIIATGIRRRRLGVEGEREFAGRGLLESGVASKELVDGKRVVIVGGGDAAFENAVILADRAGSVTLLHRSASFTARDEFVTQVRENPKINVIENVKLSKITGDDAVRAVEYVDIISGDVRMLAADAVLVRIGVEPNTGILPDAIKLDEFGYVVTDKMCMTSVQFVFAIGDVANRLAPTISGAAGDAATAAKAAYRLLRASKKL